MRWAGAWSYRVRRVLPARRTAVPGARRLRRPPQHENGIGMAAQFEPRCGPSSRAEPVGIQRDPHRVLRLGRRRPGRGLPRTPCDRIAHRIGARVDRRRRVRPDRRRIGPTEHRHHPAHGRVRRPGARAASPTTSPPPPAHRCALVPVANRFFGGNIAVTGLLTGADVARGRRRRAGGRAHPAPRRRALERSLPRRHHPRRPAASGRDRRHRRRVARPGRSGHERRRSRWSRSSAVRTSASRPS